MQIKRIHGEQFETLSDEVYQIKKHDPTERFQHPYPVGTKVRLISGVDGSKIPGYHFVKGFVTYCPVDAEYACFIGIKRKNLKKLVAGRAKAKS